MKTLFLNPNSSEAITNTLRRQIDAQGWLPTSYEVRCLTGAPQIIGSLHDEVQSEALLEKHYEELTHGFTRLVMMSSLDTGFETARRLGGIDVYGFTRSVLAWHQSQAQQLQVITFDPSMTPLYQALFSNEKNKSVVLNSTVIAFPPAAVADAWRTVLDLLRRICRQLAEASPSPIFIVGAVGLDLGEALRQEGFRQVIDPVANLIAHLQSTAFEPSGHRF
jgi:Asp/Glu/hydantoin racemase